MRDEVDLYDSPAPIPELAGADGRMDPASAFATLFPYRLNSVKDLEDFTTFLEDTTPPLRERILRWPSRDQTVADNLLNQVWLAEYQSESPNWLGLIIALNELRQKASTWNAAPLALAAATIAARTYDENLRERGLAIEVLDATEKELGPSLAWQDARALLHCNAGSYQLALGIWAEILPKLEDASRSKDLGVVFTHANAARAAGHLSKWAQALDLFLGAHRCSLQFDQPRLTVGLLADAGFAAWKAGMSERAVCLFRKALERLAKVFNHPSQEREFALHKRVGHVLMWVADHDRSSVAENFVEPPPGCCSNLDAPAGITDLNPTPLPMSWATLAKIEYKYTGNTKVYDQVSENPAGRKYPAFRFTMSVLAMEISYAALSMKNVAKMLLRCAEALNAIENHKNKGLDVWEEDG